MSWSMKPLFFLFTFFLATTSFANNPGVSYQGRIFKPDGNPLEGTTVQFRMQVRSPGSENCLLYEEVQTLNMAGSSGVFALTMNDGTGTRLDTATYQVDRIFANRETMTLDSTRCATGTTYTPNSTDGRKLIVYFKDETMAAYEAMPLMNLNYVPQAMYALEAQKVDKFEVSSILRAVDGSGNPATAPALNPTQLLNLNTLLATPAANYVQTTSNGSAALPVVAGNPSSGLAAGQIWYDSGSNVMKYYDGAVKTFGTSGGGVTSIVAGTGLTGGTITTSGTIAVDVGVTTGKIIQVGASDKLPAIDGSNLTNITATDATKLPLAGGTMTGPLVNNSSSASTALSVTQAGAGYAATFMGGNVGIGTTSPSSPLEIQKTFTDTSGIVYLNRGLMTVSPSAATTGSFFGARYSVAHAGTASGGTLYGTGNQVSKTGVGVSVNAMIGTYNQVQRTEGNVTTLSGTHNAISSGSSNNATTVHGTLNGLIMSSGSTNAYGSYSSITQSNGTTDSSYGSYVTISNNPGFGNTTNAYGFYAGSIAGLSKWSFYASDATAPSYFAGNVGIGNTAPGSLLSVGNGTSTNGSFRIDNDANITQYGGGHTFYSGSAGYNAIQIQPLWGYSGILFADGGSTAVFDAGISYSASGTLEVNSGTTGQFRDLKIRNLATSGNVGIGVTSPQAALDVVSTGTSSAVIVPRATTGNRPTTLVNGMIRYNTTTALFEFYQNGGWVNYTTVSDGRLKTNVTPVNQGLDIINQLNPVFFDWDQNNPRAQGFGSKHQVGFIAQEVEKVLPEVVNKGEDSYRSVEYGKIVSVVVAAVKELYAKVMGHDEKIQAQDREIASVKAQVDAKTAQLEAENNKLKQENAAIKARLEKIEKALNSK